MSNIFDGHISQFGPGDGFHDKSNDNIDFSQATLVPTSGSTCDCYITQYQHHRVFIKRLKKEFREKPVYRTAMEKEFKVGVNLRHPSLPAYNEFHDDYIIIDFIDGLPLSELIKKHDPWLSKPNNIRKILLQLLEALQFLHDHGVIHSDLKADNILITNGIKNLVLIDLDKCYTDSYNSTPGDSQYYGVDRHNTGNPIIDFHGLGILLNKLEKNIPNFPAKSFKHFKEECLKKETSLDNLKSKLIPHKKFNIPILIMSFSVIGLIFIGSFFLNPNDSTEISQNIIPNKDTLYLVDNTVASIENPVSSSAFSSISSKQTSSSTVDNLMAQVNQNSTEIQKMKSKDEYKDIINDEMKELIIPVQSVMKEAREILNDSTSTDEELRKMSFKLTTSVNDLLHNSYEHFEGKFPSVNPVDVQMTVGTCKTYSDLMKEMSKLTNDMMNETLKRHPENAPYMDF